MDPSGRIETLITPTVEDLGYEVVRVQLSGKKRPRLQVMVERMDGRPMTVDDCADTSRAISALLDVEDPIESAYTLEVSSPGIDRPLTRAKDFERFAGFVARVEATHTIDGRKRFTGRLLGIEDETVRIDVDGTAVGIPFADVQKAKLVMTDELLAAAEREQEL